MDSKVNYMLVGLFVLVLGTALVTVGLWLGATRNEKDVTRGRANTLRLAISGQLGPDALASDAMMETLKLCVSCKACRHECPTGVDMAKMKIEVLAARAKKHGLTLRDRLVGYLPRYAGLAARRILRRFSRR